MSTSSNITGRIADVRALFATGALAALAVLMTTGCGSAETAELCPVSGEKLGSMGEPYLVEHDGRQIKLCCEGCKDDFASDPAKYAAKVAK
jgi:YHS domain-containing protein